MAIRFILLFCLCIGMVGLLLGWIIANRLYRPIRKLSDIVHQEREDSASSFVDIRTVTDNITSIIDKSKDIEELLREHSITQRGVFLRALTNGEGLEIHDIAENLSHYALDIDIEAEFIVFCISMNNYLVYLKKYDLTQKKLQQIFELKQITSCALQETKCYCIEMKFNEVLLVCQIPELGRGENYLQWSFRLAQRIKNEISLGMEYTFTIGVSGKHLGIDSIPLCYQEAYFALSRRMLLNDQSVIFYDSLLSPNQTNTFSPLQKEKEILANLRTADLNGIMNSLWEFKALLSNNASVDQDNVRGAYLHLFSISIHHILEIAPFIQARTTIAEDWLKSLFMAENLDQMHDILRNYFTYVIEAINTKRSARNTELLQAVCVYIGENLSADLSIDRIAGNHYISSSYLRKIFKDEFGCTIKEHINNIKMETAEKMLLDKIGIADIAEAIGYSTVQSFTVAFTQAKGISPAKYRKENASRPEQMHNELKG